MKNNWENATAQEIFDHVVTHLLSQNARATDGFKCYYRAPNGLKCAVGCLIDDADYKPIMEDEGLVKLAMRFSYVEQHAPLLVQLQATHDHHPPPAWPGALQSLANNFGLQYKGLEKTT